MDRQTDGAACNQYRYALYTAAAVVSRVKNVGTTHVTGIHLSCFAKVKIFRLIRNIKLAFLN